LEDGRTTQHNEEVNMFEHILIPTDGSELSEAAVEKGIQLAKSLSAKVTGFHVILPFHVFTTRTQMLEDTKEHLSPFRKEK
jgi:nucleotide-binding universal stress UspA family protein